MDNVISLYDMYNIHQKPPLRFSGHKSQKEFYGKLIILTFIVRANFGYYDDFIISGSEDEKIHIWDVKKKKEILQLGSND